MVWFPKLSRWDRLILSCELIFFIFTISSECLCNTVGSVDTSCTDDGGVCTCNTGYTGTKCDTCADGWFMINGVCYGKFPLFMYILNDI